jgi:biopolymer transport protein ExbB/TolQ
VQQTQEFKLLQYALILLGCIAFALFLLIDKGFLQLALLSDSSRLSWVIIALYMAATLHWIWLCYQLSLEQRYISLWQTQAETNLDTQTYSHRLRQSLEDPNHSNWNDEINLLADELTNKHALGHFAADTLIKLGLIGTVIGFILMLQPIGNIKQFDPSLMQQLLTAMSSGMAIALYTTLAGLTTSILLKIQYYLADSALTQIINGLSQIQQKTPADHAT